MTTQDIDSIIDEWFGPLHEGCSADDRVSRWFTKDPTFDTLLKERYGHLVESALAGELDDFAETARGRLALILLLDQFTRNIYRNTARMFAGDAAALVHAKACLDSTQAEQLPHQMQCFVLMPLMHSEGLADQERCVQQFSALLDQAPEALKKRLENNLLFAERHRDIVAQFGRFPHRNELLGRPSTPQETAFLLQPGSSF